MFDVRKIGLTAIALSAFGVMSTPALAQMGNPELDRGATQAPSAVHNDFDPAFDANNNVVAPTTDTQANFNSFDENGDNQITQDEFADNVDVGISIDTFSELDIDLNGSLDQQEFAKLSRVEMNTDTATGMR
jgi:hypothetical protein